MILLPITMLCMIFEALAGIRGKASAAVLTSNPAEVKTTEDGFQIVLLTYSNAFF